MLRLQVNPSQPPDREILDEVSRTIQRGGIVAFPTETLYGLSVDPRNPAALERLFQIKQRPRSRQLPFVAADLTQSRQLARVEGTLALQLAGHFWPGPLTLVVPLRPDHSLAAWDWGSSLGIRVPASALVRGLAAHLRIPLPATSANLSGENTAADPAEFPNTLTDSIDLLLDSGRLPPSLPSTIVSLVQSPPGILRHGAISESELAPFLGLARAPVRPSEA